MSSRYEIACRLIRHADQMRTLARAGRAPEPVEIRALDAIREEFDRAVPGQAARQ